MSHEVQKPEVSEENPPAPKGNTCSPSGGSCMTAPRMCPGFALMGGWLVSYPIFYFTGSRNLTLVVMVAVAAALMMGLHTRLWRTLKRVVKPTHTI